MAKICNNQEADEILMEMTMEQANKILEWKGKKRWCDLHNKGANLYSCFTGVIKEVDPSGWYY